MHSEVLKINKEIATEMLKKNTNNFRRINDTRVAMYADDMANGRWQLNGEAIMFGSDGALRNGQHRLHAIIKANAEVEMLVVYDVDADIFDVGRLRSDWQINHVSSKVIGASRVILHIVTGNSNTVGKGQLSEFVTQNKDLFQIAESISSKGVTHALGNRSAIVAAIATLIKTGYSPVVIEQFMRVVNTGIPSDDYDSTAAIIMRNHLFHMYRSAIQGRIKECAIMLQAFADFINNKRRIKSYKLDPYVLDKIKAIWRALA